MKLLTKKKQKRLMFDLLDIFLMGSDALKAVGTRQPMDPAQALQRQKKMIDKPIILGRYSPSQNGIVVSPRGPALCLAGGGNGHDTDKPKILIEYEM